MSWRQFPGVLCSEKSWIFDANHLRASRVGCDDGPAVVDEMKQIRDGLSCYLDGRFHIAVVP